MWRRRSKRSGNNSPARHEATEKQLDELLTERAKLVERQRELAEDTTLAEKQIELGVVAAKFERAREAWRERAVVSQMLEHVRHDYEQHRQPETLQEASGYFRQLTGGLYTRVWTPLANDVLFVDREDGTSLAVESLSRGTREQLFLSVRLALVATFARRGIQLPMILDDVLVNYDERRAAVAAKVLCEFAAAGHQLLVFTCHEHILQIFKKLSADCRRLPSRFGEVFDDEPQEVAEEILEEPVEEVIEVEPEVVEAVAEEVAEEPEPEYYYTATIAPRKKPEPEPVAEELVEYDYDVPIAPSDAVEYDWQHDDPDYRDAERYLERDSPHGERLVEPLVYTQWD